MLHVKVTVNRSPTFTAFLSVFHQQVIGSTSTSPGACGFCGAGAALGDRATEGVFGAG
jgi:hypothetical protein